MVVLGSVLLIKLRALAVSTPSVLLIPSGGPGGLLVAVNGKPPIYQDLFVGASFLRVLF